MDGLLQDIKVSVRRLLHSGGFAIMAIGTLAIGIGANTAVFTLINAVQLRPLPFMAPDRLVDLHEFNADPNVLCTGCGVGTSYANFLDWKKSARSFSSMAAYDENSAAVAIRDAAQSRRVGRISAEVFPMLGVTPERGRFFTRDEDERLGARVALLGHALAVSTFGADTNPVGRTIRIDGQRFEIIGVMPERFVFPEHADLWIPFNREAYGNLRDDRNIGVVARLADGVGIAQAAAEMTAIGQQLATMFPKEQKGWMARLSTLHDDLASDYTAQGALLFGAMSCLLLICCANLANLMLARATARRPELAVRAALGASRFQLMRQLLVESTVVALAGGLFGLTIAMWGVEFLHSVAADALPRWISYDMDWRVFAYTVGISLFTGLAFGILPARVAARASVSEVLKDGGRGSTGGRTLWRARDVLVVLQVSIAVVVVITAGLLTRSMIKSWTLDMGYDTANLIRADVGASGSRYEDGASVVNFANRLADALQRGSGVSKVALSGTHFHNWPGTPPQAISIDDVAPDQAAAAIHRISTVTPSYFGTLGLRVLNGRAFNDRDIPGSQNVAMLSANMARSLWGDKPAVGRHIRIGSDDWLVVGVVAPMRESPLGNGASPILYVPLAQHPLRLPTGQPLTLHVRTAPGAREIAQLIRVSVASLDPDVTADQVMTVEAFLRQWQSITRILALLAGILGVFACVLASIGIYGLISYIVTQRTHEIGIRMALGATVPEVMNMVLRHGVRLGTTGLAIGLIVAAAVTRFLGSDNGVGILFGVNPKDPVVFVLVSVGFVLVALVASYVPARHATKIDPTEALRAE